MRHSAAKGMAVLWLCLASTVTQLASAQKFGSAVYGFYRVNDKNMLRLSSTGTPTVQFKLTTQAKTGPIPQSFLGLSYEVTQAYTLGSPALHKLMKDLMAYNTGPLVVRVGGISSDRDKSKYNDAKNLNGLAALVTGVNARLIVGVSLWFENAQVPQQQIQKVLSKVPADKIMSFGVGNEPDMYNLPCEGGNCIARGLQKPNTWVGQKWVPTSRDILQKLNKQFGKKLSGPEWSTLAVKPDVFQWWLGSNAGAINMVTVHHYSGGANNARSDSLASLLSDSSFASKQKTLQQIVQIARKAGNLPVRVTESNTLSYGGFNGVCNTLGAGLWALDTSLKMAAAGATGINFHQLNAKDNSANYNAIDLDTTNQNRVRVKAPFYGMLLFQMAVAGGGVKIMNPQIKGDTNNCKPWLLQAPNGDFRIVLINKNTAGKACIMKVDLDRWVLQQYQDTAKVEYVIAQNGIKETYTVYLSGQAYPLWGTQRFGKYEPFTLRRWEYPGGRGGGLYMMLPDGTPAAVVTLKRRGKGDKPWKPVPAPASAKKPAAKKPPAKPPAGKKPAPPPPAKKAMG